MVIKWYALDEALISNEGGWVYRFYLILFSLLNCIFCFMVLRTNFSFCSPFFFIGFYTVL